MPQPVIQALLRMRQDTDGLNFTDASASAGIHVNVSEIPGIEVLSDHLQAAFQARTDGAWQRFPESIFLDTMKCFSRFVKEYHTSCGSYGFDRGFWTTRQINAKLFRIGSLEYELTGQPGESQHRIWLHIPGDADLSEGAMDESLESAEKFMEEYFPEYADMNIWCDSWLLSPVLADLLPASSRILSFQKRFQLEKYDPAPNDYLEWVYSFTPEGAERKDVDLRALPEKTSLQRRMKAYVMGGGRVGVGLGKLVR